MCGGILSSKSGRITSPNYPGDYFSNLNCLWTVKVPGAVQFEVKFSDFSLEDDPNCINDRIFTFEMTKVPYSECGTTVRNKTIDGDTFTLEFVTNDLFNARGFDLLYTSFTQEDLTKLTTSIPVNSLTKEKQYEIKTEISRGRTLNIC